MHGRYKTYQCDGDIAHALYAIGFYACRNRRVKPRPHQQHIVEATFDFVEATFDIVERIVQLVAFDDVAWTLLLV